MFELTLALGSMVVGFYILAIIFSKVIPESSFVDNLFAIWFYSMMITMFVIAKDVLTCGLSLNDIGGL